ncbi:hypothetical protein PIROE2DRAFT_61093 [Piromyces sp. E2]|nr:hypothetical protein PIROE2DRAFT_61093 [Piromyces sp. E2]|eukprot:OUM63781.1 hypothetical protein PIROE2DRAFT_61093 [Piromyces sp. E2]
MTNIKTNYKYLLLLNDKNSIINDLFVEHISCVGDIGDSSFIILDSGESMKKITMNNIIISNSESNGPFIELKGKGTELFIQNSVINNTVSYGPTIVNQSEMVNIFLSNFTFENNINKNKLDCGGLQFTNNINITINNSLFYNNISKNNGGAICLDNIVDATLILDSNKFTKNHAVNGGALYLENKNNISQGDTKTTILFNNNIFNENDALNFGGAIYSNYDKLYLANVSNNNITHNNAGVMGGGIYSPKHTEMTLFSLRELKIMLEYDEEDDALDSRILGNICTFSYGIKK